MSHSRQIKVVSAWLRGAELIIQLIKIVIGLAFGAYFLWWSLEVLNRRKGASESIALD